MGSGVNDRFAYGHAGLVRAYIETRWRRMHAPALRPADAAWAWPPTERDAGWQLRPRGADWPECMVAELLSCWFVSVHNVSVGFTATRFYRLRADLSTPDIDNATVLRKIPVRPWMRGHLKVCPSLDCARISTGAAVASGQPLSTDVECTIHGAGRPDGQA